MRENSEARDVSGVVLGPRATNRLVFSERRSTKDCGVISAEYAECARLAMVQTYLIAYKPFVSGANRMTCLNEGMSSSITLGVTSFGARNVRS